MFLYRLYELSLVVVFVFGSYLTGWNHLDFGRHLHHDHPCWKGYPCYHRPCCHVMLRRRNFPLEVDNHEEDVDFAECCYMTPLLTVLIAIAVELVQLGLEEDAECIVH